MPFIDEYNQATFFEHFKIIGKDGEILTITGRTRFVGNFSPKNIASLIPDALSASIICKISTETHACTLGYNHNKREYWFYDPSAKFLYFCANKLSLAKIIIARLGHSLYINHFALSSLKDNFNAIMIGCEDAYIRSMKNGRTLELLEYDANSGLGMIVKYAPEKITQILELANKNQNVRAALASELRAKRYGCQPPNITGFAALMLYRKENSEELLKLAESHESVRKAMVQALIIEEDKSILSKIIITIMQSESSEKLFAELLKAAKKNPKIKQVCRYAR